MALPRTIKTPRRIIWETLREHGPLTWSQLLEKTKLSKGALSKHLKELKNDWQWIVTAVDTETRPPTTIYHPIGELPEEFYENPVEFYEGFVRFATLLALKHGTEIGEMKDRKLAQNILARYLKTNLGWIASFISDNMYKAYAYARGRIDGRPSFIKSKDASKEIAKTIHVFHEEIRKHYMRRFLEPWVEALADAYLANLDIAEEVFAQTAKKFGLQDTSWKKILEKSEKKG